MSRIIFVNRFFYPDESATAALLTDLAFDLADRGMDIHVVTGRSHYTGPTGRLEAREVVRGVTVHRIPTLRNGNARLRYRVINFISFYLFCVVALLRHASRGDQVVCLTDPPFGAAPAYLAARIKGARFINWVQDVFPETATVLGFTTRTGVLSRTIRLARDLVWRQADCNVVIGSRMRAYLESRGVRTRTIKVIANWADEDELAPLAQDASEVRRLWGFSPGDCVVAYAGNLGRAHDIGTMLDAMEILARKGAKHIKFVFVGGGVKLKEVDAFVAEKQLTNVFQFAYQPKSRLRDSLAAADIHWLSLIPELEGYIVPSKFYGIAAIGRPMLYVGAKNGEVAEQISRFECGHVVEPHQAALLANRILALSTDPEERARLGANGRRMIETHFPRRRGLGEWWSILNHSPLRRQEVARTAHGADEDALDQPA